MFVNLPRTPRRKLNPCQNKECSRTSRGIRIGEILEDVYATLDKLKFTKEDYDKFVKDMQKYVDTKLDESIVEKRSLNGLKSYKEKRVDELAAQYSALNRNTPEVIKTKLREQIESVQDEIINLEEQLETINEKIIDPASLKLTQEKFLKQLNSASFKMRAGDPVTFEQLYLVVDWCFSHRDFDPGPMVLPRDKYPVIHEWQY